MMNLFDAAEGFDLAGDLNARTFFKSGEIIFEGNAKQLPRDSSSLITKNHFVNDSYTTPHGNLTITLDLGLKRTECAHLQIANAMHSSTIFIGPRKPLQHITDLVNVFPGQKRGNFGSNSFKK